MPGTYFPYEIEPDLARLGYACSAVPTRLGRLRLARGSEQVQTLFLHGVGLDSSAWSPLVEAAGGDSSVGSWAFLDLPGFGGSDPLASGLTLDAAGGAVIDAVDALGVERVDLVGHSMGGFLALHVAATHPERFRSVTVVCGAYATIVDVVNAPLRTLRRAPRTTLVYAGLAGVARAGRLGTALLKVAARTGVLRLGMVGVAAHPLRVPGWMLRALAAGNRPASFSFAQATGTGYDYRAVWGRITVPVRAIFGERDALVTGRDAEVLASALPATKIRHLAEAGHLAPLEQPDALLALLRAG